MNNFFELWKNGPKYKQSNSFKLGTDSILLADFADLKNYKNGIDLGCGSGIITLLLLTKNQKIHMTSVDFLNSAISIAKENIHENKLSERCTILKEDIRNLKSLYPTGSMEFVITNPPYFPADCGPVAPDKERAEARSEINCTLDDLCKISSYLLKTGGHFFIVHKPQRMAELFITMSKYKIEPKRLRIIQNKPSSKPNLILVEGIRGGKTGLLIDPPLYLNNEDGKPSNEYLKIYHL